MVPRQTLRLVLAALVNSSVARGRPRPAWVSAEELGRRGRRCGDAGGGGMDGSQRGPFLGPRTPLASAGRGPPSGSRGPTQSWKDGFRESLGANTPQSILVHPVLRSPPQGLPDDLQPLALPSGFPNPTGLRVRADGDLRTVGLQMPGSDPLPLPAPSSLRRGRRPGQRSCWDVEPEGPIHPDAAWPVPCPYASPHAPCQDPRPGWSCCTSSPSESR